LIISDQGPTIAIGASVKLSHGRVHQMSPGGADSVIETVCHPFEATSRRIVIIGWAGPTLWLAAPPAFPVTWTTAESCIAGYGEFPPLLAPARHTATGVLLLPIQVVREELHTVKNESCRLGGCNPEGKPLHAQRATIAASGAAWARYGKIGPWMTDGEASQGIGYEPQSEADDHRGAPLCTCPGDHSDPEDLSL
jgi:hypothetical protein